MQYQSTIYRPRRYASYSISDLINILKAVKSLVLGIMLRTLPRRGCTIQLDSGALVDVCRVSPSAFTAFMDTAARSRRDLTAFQQPSNLFRGILS